MSSIKRTFSKSPTHREVLTKAICKTKKGPRGGKQYKCSKCKKCFSIRYVQVDHKDPVVPIGILAKDMDWNTLVDRIFCDTKNLQVLCTECHSKKSKAENKKRKEIKEKLK